MRKIMICMVNFVSPDAAWVRYYVTSKEIVVEIYRICHELTVEINYIKRVLENVIKPAFGELYNVFQDEFNKILSQQSTNVRFFLSHN